MSSTPISPLIVRSLCKRFGPRAALDNIHLELNPGEVFAILGPNGAGKTTLISTILGRLAADSGDICLFGEIQQGTTRNARMRQRVSVMMQIGSASANLTVAEQFELFRHYYPDARSLAELLSIAGLKNEAHTRFAALSGGQKQRFLFALALVGKPELVFLDEPTLGMDVLARHALWKQIRELSALGVSVVLTTHYLEEAEQLAHRIAILQQGQIIALGTAKDLITQASMHHPSTAMTFEQAFLQLTDTQEAA